MKILGQLFLIILAWVAAFLFEKYSEFNIFESFMIVSMGYVMITVSSINDKKD